MVYEDFKNLLDNNNLSLKEFSSITSLSYSGCNKWKYSGVPAWVESWFDLYEENHDLKELKAVVLRLCKEKEF